MPAEPVKKKTTRKQLAANLITVCLYGTAQQREIIDCYDDYVGIYCGRRWGKTYAFRLCSIYRCLTIHNYSVCYISPNYSTGKPHYDAIVNSDIRPLIKRCIAFPSPYIEFENGSSISFRSFDRPDSLRGFSYHLVWVDEQQNQCYSNQDTFEGVIKPLLADKRGQLIMSGQHAGKDWKYDKFFITGQKEINGKPNPLYKKRYKSFNYPTSTGLMFLSDEGKRRLEADKESVTKAMWEREYLCIPTEFVNAVFESSLIDQITQGRTNAGIENKGRPSASNPNDKYIMGLDLGSHGRDYTAIVVKNCNTGIVEYSHTIPLGTQHAEQARFVSNVQKAFNNCRVMIDITGGATGGKHHIDAFLKFYREHVKHLKEVVLTGKEKENIVKTFDLRLQEKSFWIPSEYKELITQVRNYTAEYRNNFYYYSAPKGQHDDLVIALMLAVYGQSQNLHNLEGNNPNVPYNSLVKGY